MHWLAAIIGIILVVSFWPIFLRLAIFLAAIIGVLVLVENIQSANRERERALAEQARAKVEKSLREKFWKVNSEKIGKEQEWTLNFERDPASGASVPRSAGVLSENGVCRITTEQRMDGTRLTGINCPEFKLDSYNEIEIKFDNKATSDKMNLKKFSDGDGVYIGTRQDGYEGRLNYEEFLNRMAEANKIALKLKFEVAGYQWMTFSLANAGPALTAIGAVQAPKIQPPALVSKQELGKPKISKFAPSAEAGADSQAQSLPSNAEIDYTGHSWTCKRGYRQAGNVCVAVEFPSNAEIDYTGHGWTCKRGYRQEGNHCHQVGLSTP